MGDVTRAGRSEVAEVGDGVGYVAVSALSHAGLVREHNEDSLVVGPWTLCATETQSPQTLLFPPGTPLVVAVADGLGGHPGGEVASTLVVRQLAAASSSVDGERTLREVLGSCNQTVYAAAERSPELTTMGTTVAGIVVTPDAVLAFNVGDSRVYVATAEGLRQISQDDSPPLGPGERSTVIVTQTLGGHDHFVPIHPHVVGQEPSPDDRYLVCSDGLSDLVADAAVADVLREHTDGQAVFELWKAAIDAGGVDNITLALVRFGT
jgi:serine/threonine protein phosphatase PrpC